MTFSSKTKVIMAVLALLTAIGVGAWIFQLMNGLGVTGMSNTTSWGLYIAMFMFFVGLSAGGLIVASSAHVFNIKPFQKVAIPAVICSIVCICAAGLFILIDLGGLARVWRLFTGPSFTSPLMWDVCVISAYLIINILDLYFLVTKRHKAVAILSYIALPVAILVHSVTAWIFGLQIARAWYSAIMAPIFVASACDSGLALLLIALVILEATGTFKTGKELMGSLAGLLATFIAVDGFFIACEVLTMAYPGAHEAHALSIMTSGETAPFFWFEIIGGLIIPFVLLVLPKNRTRIPVIVGASTLVILGVLAKRIWLLFTSFVTPNVYGALGVSSGTLEAQSDPTHMWQLVGTYAPTAIEIMIVVGVLSLVGLAFVLLSKRFIPSGSAQVHEA